MDFDDFQKLYDVVRVQKPLWLQSQMEPLATDVQIYAVETQLGIQLPAQYKEFLQRIGSGYFGSINVFSANPHGEWHLLNRLKQFDLPKDFIPITDDETGGYYGFKVVNKLCCNEVYYFNADDAPDVVCKYSCFYDFIVKLGLKYQESI